MRKAQNLKVQAIQKEQKQLVQIEKLLEEILGDINENINTLKVEELQLKSSLVEHITGSFSRTAEPQPSTSSQAAAAAVATAADIEPDCPSTILMATAPNEMIDERINKQLLDIESLVVNIKNKSRMDEEEEEDESTSEEEDDADEEFLPE
ncbi:PR domain zinc finger protein 2-like [Stomoxys calcitrans]|uniref:PR domain zinc finger protein 2-like n=1 Tax=Stomoxys calcitrans TaxID=35570 RepID=UPI0027E35DDB|nr:PR domain zinc finger protein 2-like [Stomoxys calcitrans]